MAATLDGLVKETGAVFEAKFMLPWSFSEEGAAEKHMAQLQHNMLVAGTKKSVLSIINGGGKWVELSIEADPIYQTILIAAEKAFWRAVKTGETPALFDCEPPKPRLEAVRVVDAVLRGPAPRIDGPTRVLDGNRSASGLTGTARGSRVGPA
jgi:predicted phage-related endonuclease